MNQPRKNKLFVLAVLFWLSPAPAFAPYGNTSPNPAFNTITTKKGKEMQCTSISPLHPEITKDQNAIKMGQDMRGAYGEMTTGVEASLKAATAEYGSILIGLQYESRRESLKVTIKRAQDLPAKDTRTQTSDPYVSVHMFQGGSESSLTRKKEMRTERRERDLNPQWNAGFRFSIPKAHMNEIYLVIKVWDWDKASNDDFIGQTALGSANLKLESIRSTAAAQWAEMMDPNSNGYATEEWHFLRSRPAFGELHLSMSLSRDLITVEVLEAKELPKMDPGGKADPYVKVAMFNGPERIKEKHRKEETKRIKNTLNPQWKRETFEFKISPNMINSYHIVATVWDKDKWSKDDIMGEVVISAANLRDRPVSDVAQKQWNDMSRSVASDQWHLLETPVEQLGGITLGLQYNPAGNGTLTVTVVRCMSLPNKDVGSASDPYVKVTLYKGTKKIGERKTFKIDNNNNPTFNDSFHFEVSNADIDTVHLAVRVWDWDRVTLDDLIGETFIGSARLRNKKILKIATDHWDRMRGWGGAEDTHSLRENKETRLDKVKRWLKEHTLDSPNEKFASFCGKVKKVLDWWKYTLVNFAIWSWLPKFVNNRLDDVARCVNFKDGLKSADLKLKADKVVLKECHGLRNTLKLFWRLSMAKMKIIAPVPAQEVIDLLPCLTKYWGRTKLGEKDENGEWIGDLSHEMDQDTQNSLAQLGLGDGQGYSNQPPGQAGYPNPAPGQGGYTNPPPGPGGYPNPPQYHDPSGYQRPYEQQPQNGYPPYQYQNPYPGPQQQDYNPYPPAPSYAPVHPAPHPQHGGYTGSAQRGYDQQQYTNSAPGQGTYTNQPTIDYSKPPPGTIDYSKPPPGPIDYSRPPPAQGGYPNQPPAQGGYPNQPPGQVDYTNSQNAYGHPAPYHPHPGNPGPYHQPPPQYHQDPNQAPYHPQYQDPNQAPYQGGYQHRQKRYVPVATIATTTYVATMPAQVAAPIGVYCCVIMGIHALMLSAPVIALGAIAVADIVSDSRRPKQSSAYLSPGYRPSNGYGGSSYAGRYGDSYYRDSSYYRSSEEFLSQFRRP